MNICTNDIGINMKNIVESYSELNNSLKLESDSDVKYTFESQCALIETLTKCRRVIIDTLNTYILISEGQPVQEDINSTKDLYKRSKVKVTYAIIYHDLKNVFAILDIAASDKSSSLTLHNITEQDLEDIYVAMLSFILQTIKAYENKFGVEGGVRHYGPRKNSAVSP